MEQKVDQSPCESMKSVAQSWESFRDSTTGQVLISSAPTICTIAVILLLTCGIKMVNTIVTEQNQCVAAQIAAGVVKTNPKEMGCL